MSLTGAGAVERSNSCVRWVKFMMFRPSVGAQGDLILGLNELVVMLGLYRFHEYTHHVKHYTMIPITGH